MKKFITVVGARPQFIKAAMLTHQFQNRSDMCEIMIHTGQHYDRNMSDQFFEDFEIPAPKYNLSIHESHHGAMTGKMLSGIEEVLISEKPDGVIVYGDTNSTLAGALAATKLHIPVIHIEAGLRSFNKKMPEEVNRVLTDHMSDLLFCPTPQSVQNLENENITKGVHLVGDVMFDAALFALEKAKTKSTILRDCGIEEKKYQLATIHRAENTDDPKKLKEVFEYLDKVAAKATLVMPLHPRTKRKLEKFRITTKYIKYIDPVGYFDMTYLTYCASKIFTDSGGLQKEAYFHQVPCVTIRDETEWVETVESGWNHLWKSDGVSVRKSVSTYEMGMSDQKITNIILQKI